MSSDHSVSQWILDLKSGDHSAAAPLWNRYFAQLVRFARSELQGTAKRMADEEDVALSVFESFCRAAELGRFPDLADRESLWRLLIGMTARKAVDQRRFNSRQCRGGKQTVITETSSPADENELAEIIGNEPTPEFAAMMAEQMQRMLNHLNDPELRQLALGKMEGYTNQEMSIQLDCSVRTVERRLMLIREKCVQELMNE